MARVSGLLACWAVVSAVLFETLNGWVAVGVMKLLVGAWCCGRAYRLRRKGGPPKWQPPEPSPDIGSAAEATGLVSLCGPIVAFFAFVTTRSVWPLTVRVVLLGVLLAVSLGAALWATRAEAAAEHAHGSGQRVSGTG